MAPPVCKASLAILLIARAEKILKSAVDKRIALHVEEYVAWRRWRQCCQSQARLIRIDWKYAVKRLLVTGGEPLVFGLATKAFKAGLSDPLHAGKARLR